ncbi:MAG: DNA-binding protein [Sedimenticola sp.]|nr:DNA-binding protein [Sedimenticola sp.]
MARQGITLDDVQTAVTEIEARNERVTLLAVRRALGDTGSMSTIRMHLETLRSRRSNENRAASELPNDLAAAISASVSTLWEHAQQIARRDIDAIRGAAMAQSEALGNELEEMSTIYDEQTEELAKIQLLKNKLSEQLREAEQTLVATKAENNELVKLNEALLLRIDNQTAALEGLINRIIPNDLENLSLSSGAKMNPRARKK